MEIESFFLKNTHHSEWGGFSSKDFRIEIQRWDDSSWFTVVEDKLEDSSGKVNCNFKISYLKLYCYCSNVMWRVKSLI